MSFAYWSFNPNSGDTGGLVQGDWETPQEGKLSLLIAALTESYTVPLPCPPLPAAPKRRSFQLRLSNWVNGVAPIYTQIQEVQLRTTKGTPESLPGNFSVDTSHPWLDWPAANIADGNLATGAPGGPLSSGDMVSYSFFTANAANGIAPKQLAIYPASDAQFFTAGRIVFGYHDDDAPGQPFVVMKEFTGVSLNKGQWNLFSLDDSVDPPPPPPPPPPPFVMSSLTTEAVEYTATAEGAGLPSGWRTQTVNGIQNPQTILIDTPIVSPASPTNCRQTIVMEVFMSASLFATHMHWVFGSRHPGQDYTGFGSNKMGSVIGGDIETGPGLVTIEEVEGGVQGSPNHNVFPVPFHYDMQQSQWFKVALDTIYSGGVSRTRYRVWNSADTLLRDLEAPAYDPAIYGRTSAITVALAFVGSPELPPSTHYFRYRNIKSYWSAAATSIDAP